MTDKKQQEHLGEFNRDFAVFLPATSGFYQNYISKQRKDPTYVEESRIPKGFDQGVEGINYNNPDKGYFT